MKIAQQGTGFVGDNQWGLDADMHGAYKATLTAEGRRFRRNGMTVTMTPSVGDEINQGALRGKRYCLRVSGDEGYCRY